jgi:hypothetical protein
MTKTDKFFKGYGIYSFTMNCIASAAILVCGIAAIAKKRQQEKAEFDEDLEDF